MKNSLRTIGSNLTFEVACNIARSVSKSRGEYYSVVKDVVGYKVSNVYA